MRCVVGIGASAGGVEALIELTAHLPSDLRAAVLVVLHVPAGAPTVLPRILARQAALPVALARDGAPLLDGHVLIAAPGRHLLVADGRIRLDRGPLESGMRPAVDPLLRSLASAYGSRATAVVLSGALDDGAAGAHAVAAAGGTVLVQDPAEAIVSSMPESALRAVGEAARALPAAAIGRELAHVAEAACEPAPAVLELDGGSVPR